MTTTISTVLTKTLGAYCKDNLYIICIQGASGSGKTTYSKWLEKTFNKAGIQTYLLHLDDFFNFSNGSKENDYNFDYDNPATIRWDAVDHVIRCLISKNKTIPSYTRSDLLDKHRGEIKNPGYNVVIIDGLYSFNCFGKERFNISQFDPFDSFKELSQEYVTNDNLLLINKSECKQEIPVDQYKKILILNVRFSICFKRLTNIRVQRDIEERKLTFNDVFPRICNFVWPATVRWVYSDKFKADINIQHGNFNRKAVENLSDDLFRFFNIKNSRFFMDIKTEITSCDKLKCTPGCDGGQDNCSLYLEDDV